MSSLKIIEVLSQKYMISLSLLFIYEYDPPSSHILIGFLLSPCTKVIVKDGLNITNYRFQVKLENGGGISHLLKMNLLKHRKRS